MKEALHDVPLLRRFVGRDAFENETPDENTILHFRQLLEKYEQAVSIFAELNAVQPGNDLSMRDPKMTQSKKPASGTLTVKQKAFTRMRSAVRAIVEHPFRVVKRQFGFVKVRYPALAKDTCQILAPFALDNLCLARKRLLPLGCEMRP